MGASVYIDGVGIAGYRSFGAELVKIGPFGSINLLAGRNNAGKSNVLSLLTLTNRILKATRGTDQRLPFDEHDWHSLSADQPVKFAFAVRVDSTTHQKMLELALAEAPQEHHGWITEAVSKLITSAHLGFDGEVAWWQYSVTEGRRMRLDPHFVLHARPALPDQDWARLWGWMLRRGSGDLMAHWVPESLDRLSPARFEVPEARVIPAFRQLQPGEVSEDLSGVGIVDRLARLQNPGALERSDAERFERVNRFVQTVLESENIRIEIPYERDTIIVHSEDGLALPISSHGTGIHEVVILAAASTLLSHEVICIEEPELHLHPVLQRKLIRYLATETNNQYVISTHSAHLLDSSIASIFHVTHNGSETSIRPALSHGERADICFDLGYRASDILQSNTVVWVEGPSDRIYLRHWIRALAPELVEGIDFTLMFYGGRLLSHLSANDPDVEDFISLKRLNRNMAVIMDSDKTSARKGISKTKRRVQKELEAYGGLAWITRGREIENYISPSLMWRGIQAVFSNAKELVQDPSVKYEYSRAYTFRRRNGEVSGAEGSWVDKVKIARGVTSLPAELHRLDLRSNVQRIVDRIRVANGA